MQTQMHWTLAAARRSTICRGNQFASARRCAHDRLMLSAALVSRLCGACGMCCNGVMFSSVELQPEDSARKLAALGLRAKLRGNALRIPQPCQAHQSMQCSIYADRPARCRAFDCKQLKAAAAGEISPDEALEKIEVAVMMAERVRALFRQAGDDREHRAFATRVASIFTPPLEPGPDAEAARDALRVAMDDLEEHLTRYFRVEPVTWA